MQNHATKIENIVSVDAIYAICTHESRLDCWEILYRDAPASDREHLALVPPGVAREPESAEGSICAISFSCASPLLAGGTYPAGDMERALLRAILTESRDAFACDPTIDALAVRDGLAAQSVRQMLELLLVRLIRSRAIPSSRPKEPQASYFQIAARYIEDHIDSELGVEALSALAGVSPSYLERLFHRATSMSVIGYCRARRIERAKELMREGRMSVTAIAAATGFSSVHYFSRTFKALAGIAPREYMRSFR